jgi:predicted RNA-binding protein YlxR (DUF448 family)
MVKREPIRSCVGCNKRRMQHEMVRFVRNSSGSVIEINQLGRGAYLCADTKERCLIHAIQKRTFDRALPRNDFS